MYLQKSKILLNIIVCILVLSILKNCKKINYKKQSEKLEYSAEQKDNFNDIISTIIIPEQKQFPPLLTFKKPEKLYIANNTNLLTDSISIDYLGTNNLFNEIKFEEIRDQNNYKLQDFHEILKYINLSDIDSTKGTITKVVYTPIINSKKNNAFLRIKTLDSGHFLDVRDYWLQKENNKWKIMKYEMIAWH